MKNYFIIIALYLIVSKATAQKQHPIDIETEKCIDKNYSTSGMVECADQAYTKWDAELNKNYKLLMSKLTEPEKLKLKTSQIAWLKFRDSEFSVLRDLYSKKEGTMYIPMAIQSRVEIIKQRALELNSHYVLLNDEY